MLRFKGLRWRQLWSAGSAATVAVFVGVDWLARKESGRSFVAPTAALLWVSIGFGTALGGAMLAAMWFAPRRQREFAAEFARLPLRERRRWKYQRRNLLYHGWLLVAFLALAVWHLYWGVFILPTVYAMNVVVFAAQPRWAIQQSDDCGARTSEIGANETRA